MPKNLQRTDLKSILASIATRQNLLAAWPVAMRVIPLAALAGADAFEKNYGWNPMKDVLGSSDAPAVGLNGPTAGHGASNQLSLVDARTRAMTTLDLVESMKRVTSMTLPAPTALEIAAYRHADPLGMVIKSENAYI